MLRNRTNSGSRDLDNRKHEKDTIILPPSPKIMTNNRIASEPIRIKERCKIQCANPIFDPNNASPGNEFINVLKLRMSIYYEPDLNIFDTK